MNKELKFAIIAVFIVAFFASFLFAGYTFAQSHAVTAQAARPELTFNACKAAFASSPDKATYTLISVEQTLNYADVQFVNPEIKREIKQDGKHRIVLLETGKGKDVSVSCTMDGTGNIETRIHTVDGVPVAGEGFLDILILK